MIKKVGKYLMIGSRIVVICLSFITRIQWALLAFGFHYLIMLAWIIIQWTSFKQNERKMPFRFCFKYSFIYCFYFQYLENGQENTRRRFCHCLLLIENTLLAILYILISTDGLIIRCIAGFVAIVLSCTGVTIVELSERKRKLDNNLENGEIKTEDNVIENKKEQSTTGNVAKNSVEQIDEIIDDGLAGSKENQVVLRTQKLDTGQEMSKNNWGAEKRETMCSIHDLIANTSSFKDNSFVTEKISSPGKKSKLICNNSHLSNNAPNPHLSVSIDNSHLTAGAGKPYLSENLSEGEKIHPQTFPLGSGISHGQDNSLGQIPKSQCNNQSSKMNNFSVIHNTSLPLVQNFLAPSSRSQICSHSSVLNMSKNSFQNSQSRFTHITKSVCRSQECSRSKIISVNSRNKLKFSRESQVSITKVNSLNSINEIGLPISNDHTILPCETYPVPSNAPSRDPSHAYFLQSNASSKDPSHSCPVQINAPSRDPSHAYHPVQSNFPSRSRDPCSAFSRDLSHVEPSQSINEEGKIKLSNAVKRRLKSPDKSILSQLIDEIPIKNALAECSLDTGYLTTHNDSEEIFHIDTYVEEKNKNASSNTTYENVFDSVSRRESGGLDSLYSQPCRRLFIPKPLAFNENNQNTVSQNPILNEYENIPAITAYRANTGIRYWKPYFNIQDKVHDYSTFKERSLIQDTLMSSLYANSRIFESCRPNSLAEQAGSQHSVSLPDLSSVVYESLELPDRRKCCHKIATKSVDCCLESASCCTCQCEKEVPNYETIWHENGKITDNYEGLENDLIPITDEYPSAFQLYNSATAFRRPANYACIINRKNSFSGSQMSQHSIRNRTNSLRSQYGNDLPIGHLNSSISRSNSLKSGENGSIVSDKEIPNDQKIPSTPNKRKIELRSIQKSPIMKLLSKGHNSIQEQTAKAIQAGKKVFYRPRVHVITPRKGQQSNSIINVKRTNSMDSASVPKIDPNILKRKTQMSPKNRLILSEAAAFIRKCEKMNETHSEVTDSNKPVHRTNDDLCKNSEEGIQTDSKGGPQHSTPESQRHIPQISILSQLSSVASPDDILGSKTTLPSLDSDLNLIRHDSNGNFYQENRGQNIFNSKRCSSKHSREMSIIHEFDSVPSRVT